MPIRDSRKSRRTRPSRARGLRTSTGCLVCRKRRIKCDEATPRCGQCIKSNRDCVYGNSKAGDEGNEQQQKPRYEARDVGETEENSSSNGGNIDDINANLTSMVRSSFDDGAAEGRVNGLGQLGPVVDQALQVDNGISVPEVLDTIEAPPAADTGVSPSGVGFSPIVLAHESFWSTSALEWYDLLAQDAIADIQRHNNGATAAARWNFDESSLSRRPTPEPEAGGPRADRNESAGTSARLGAAGDPSPHIPDWNTSEPIPIIGDDLFYFRHYIEVVSPILDLFDAGKHFTNVVPHLATRNMGLLKAILAVAGRHASRSAAQSGSGHRDSFLHVEPEYSPDYNESFSSKSGRLATQYYYETLQYLSQTLSLQSYADSLEILATAILISAYEMFGSNGPFNNSEWERHLRGAFWIQRCQDNDGESTNGLRRAVWWGWLRQDMFAAFLAGRPVMTFWRPKKSLGDLDADEHATRILYISAKVVDFANASSEVAANDIQKRMATSSKLWEALQSWDALLPASFKPLETSSRPVIQDAGSEPHLSRYSETSPSVQSQGVELQSLSEYEPIWIHPPSHAGAVQTYHFARIILLLHTPTLGGVNAYKSRQRQLDESVKVICGIATNDLQTPSLAFVHVQALYAAGLCLQSLEKRNTLITLLERALQVSSFPTKDLIGNLRAHWDESV